MSQAPNIDGVLITWGDRLFYPGNRVVKVKPQSKLNGGSAHQRAAAIRERVEATVVRRAPQVMVKVTGGGRGMKAIAAHFRYIGKNGRLDIEDERGETMRGKDTLHANWLSMPHGTDPLTARHLHVSSRRSSSQITNTRSCCTTTKSRSQCRVQPDRSAIFSWRTVGMPVAVEAYRARREAYRQDRVAVKALCEPSHGK